MTKLWDLANKSIDFCISITRACDRTDHTAGSQLKHRLEPGSSRDGQTARASSKLEPKMASFHSSAPAPKKNSRAKKLGSGSKIENQSQKARLWLQNKTNQSQKLGSGSRIFLRLDHQWPKCYIAIGNVCVILNHYQSITLVISVEHSTITKALHW